jgi:hypothetical protein
LLLTRGSLLCLTVTRPSLGPSRATWQLIISDAIPLSCFAFVAPEPSAIYVTDLDTRVSESASSTSTRYLHYSPSFLATQASIFKHHSKLLPFQYWPNLAFVVHHASNPCGSTCYYHCSALGWRQPGLSSVQTLVPPSSPQPFHH